MMYLTTQAKTVNTTKPIWLYTSALIAAMLWVLCVKPAKALEIGETAPNWMLYNTNGEAVLLYEELPKSAKTVLFFWASWCQRCSELLPTLSQLASLNASENAQVFTLNLWDEQDPTEHLASLNTNLPTLIKAEAVAQRYGVAGTPAIIVIDDQRQVIAVQQAGEVTPQTLAHWLHPKVESSH